MLDILKKFKQEVRYLSEKPTENNNLDQERQKGRLMTYKVEIFNTNQERVSHTSQDCRKKGKESESQ